MRRAPFLWYEKARRRRALERARRDPRLSFRQASLGPSLDPFAGAMLAVLEAEDALPAPWVGHSLGGLVGLRAAARRPEAITGLVLAAAAGISSATRLGEATVTAVGVVKPGRILGRR